MNVQDVVDRVQRQFGDESGVQVTNDDIIRWVNDAQRDIGQAQEILETIATTPSVVGQAAYVIPDDIINLKRVTYAGKNIKNVSLQEFDQYITDNQLNPLTGESGDPEIYYSYGEELSFYPVPDTDADDIKLYYSQFPAEVTLVSDDLTLPIKYHNRIVEYCLQQAYELDENFEAASYKEGQFSNSMAQMKEDVSWKSHEFYPNITVMPEDL